MARQVNSLPCEPGNLSLILGTHIKSQTWVDIETGELKLQGQLV